MGIEKGIETAILNYIVSIGGWATKVHSGSILKTTKGRTYKINLATAGTPDILACIQGKFLGIEVKKDEKEIKKWFKYPLGLRGKPVKFNQRIEDQQHQRTLIRKSKGIHIICSSVEEFETDLRTLRLV